MNWNFVSSSKNILLHNELESEPLLEFNSHLDDVNRVIFNQNGMVIASCGTDGKIKLIHINQKAEIMSLQENDKNSNINCIDFSHNSTLIASGDNNGTMKVWNIRQKEIEFKSTSKYHEISDIKFNYNSELLAFGTSMGELKIMDYKSKNIIMNHEHKTYNGIKALNFSPHLEDMIFTAGSDGTVGIFNYTTNQKPKYLKIHSNKCTGLEFHPSNQNLLLTTGLDESFNVLDLRTNSVAKNLNIEFPLTCLAIGNDGYNVFLGGYFGDLISIDIRNDSLMKYEGHKNLVSSINYMPDVKKIKKIKRQSEKNIYSKTSYRSSNKSYKEPKTASKKNIPNNNYLEKKNLNLVNAESRYYENDNLSKNKSKRVSKKNSFNNQIEKKTNYSQKKISHQYLSENVNSENIIKNGQEKLNVPKIDKETKEELKDFIRQEINNLKIDMIKEFEIQKQEIKKIIIESLKNHK